MEHRKALLLNVQPVQPKKWKLFKTDKRETVNTNCKSGLI